MEFYVNLFFSESIDLLMKENILSEILIFFSESDRELCEGILFFVELIVSVKLFNYNKVLGLDGFSVEFYLKFWDFLGF